MLIAGKPKRKTEGVSRKRRFVLSRQRSNAVWKPKRNARQSRNASANRNDNALSKRPNNDDHKGVNWGWMSGFVAVISIGLPDTLQVGDSQRRRFTQIKEKI
jgi:hypothetical protein